MEYLPYQGRDASRGHAVVLFEPHSILVGTFLTVEPS